MQHTITRGEKGNVEWKERDSEKSEVLTLDEAIVKFQK